MDTKEIIQKIHEAKNIEWFNTKKVSINFSCISIKPSFESLTSFFEFVNDQVEGWQKLDQSLATTLNNSQKHFTTLKAQIVHFVNTYFNVEKPEQLDAHWQSLVQPQLQQLIKCFTYDCVETKFLNNLNKNNPNYLHGAFQFFNGQLGNLADKNYFIGAVMAYEFALNEKSKIFERSNNEAESLEELKNKFQKNIDESNIQLVEHLKQSTDKYQAYSIALDEYKTTKQTEVNTWLDNTKTGFNTFDVDAKKRIEELEKTYQEKLSLEAPAQYWEKRALELKTEGKKWLNYLIWSVSIGVIILVVLLIIIANNKFEEIFSFSGKTIRWSILLITLISFIAYAIRTFTKLTFSTYHLVRDAEERKQLTFVYLALKENNAVTDAERLVILQSLFSRADTGLLKEDSSPTMPSGIDKLMNK